MSDRPKNNPTEVHYREEEKVMSEELAKQDLSAGLPMEVRCAAHKKNGVRCGKRPIRGATVCGTHGGSAPQVRRKAQERILAASDMAAGRLIEFMNDKSVPWSVRLAATRDLLDRAAVTERQQVEVAVTHAFDAVLEGIVDDAVATRRASGQDRALSAGEGAGVAEDQAAEDARDAAELRAVDDMAAASARDASAQERVAAGSGGETFGPWGEGASPDADGHYTVTRLPGRDDEALPSYLRDPDERGRADFSR